MGDRPGHFVRRARGRRFAALLALILCAALVDVPSVWAGPAQRTAAAAAPIVDVDSTSPVAGTGTVSPDGSGGYNVQLPYFRIGVVHHYTFLDATGKVVDEADVTVPEKDGEVVTVTTKNGGTLTLKTDHVDGVIQANGADSPSSGKGTLKPATAAKKAKKKKNKKQH